MSNLFSFSLEVLIFGVNFHIYFFCFAFSKDKDCPSLKKKFINFIKIVHGHFFKFKF